MKQPEQFYKNAEEVYLDLRNREVLPPFGDSEKSLIIKAIQLYALQSQSLPAVEQPEGKTLEILQYLLDKQQELSKETEHSSVKESTANKMYCLRTVMDMINDIK